MKTLGSWMAIACVAFALGCSKSEPTPPKELGGTQSPPKPVAPPDPTAQKLAALADKPDVYVQAQLDSFAAGDTRVVWNMLPSKQQADVLALKNEFAANVDADVWNKAFVVLGKLTQVLKAKKQMVMATPMFEAVKPFEKNWDNVVNVIDSIVQSEIKTIDGLKSADPAVFLAATGDTLLKGAVQVADSVPPAAQSLDRIRKAKVTLVKHDGDSATLSVMFGGETEPQNEQFTRVEGKWVPAELLAGWDANITAAKASLADLKKLPPGFKAETINGLTAVEKKLDALLAATDQKAFDAEFEQLAGDIQAMASPPTSGPGALTPPPGAPSPTAGPGSIPPAGSLPKPSGSISPPPGTPPAGPSLNGSSSNGPSLGTPPLSAPASGAAPSTPSTGAPATGPKLDIPKP